MVLGERMEETGPDSSETKFRETEEEWENLAEITAEFQGYPFLCNAYINSSVPDSSRS